jgi:hypothetical protein
MRRWMSAPAVLLAGVLLWGGLALAQAAPAGCNKAGTPEKLEGQVVKVDPDQGKVTMRGSDGVTHELQADKETLQKYKVGDRIEAKLRSAPDCK